MFAGFDLRDMDTGDATLRVRVGGDGPPLVLLHGHPRTHATWHKVAPRLAQEFRVVCPDLRGYGRSSKPPTTPDHAPYSKRAMALDVLRLMRSLGHDKFAVAGHDRGSYVAFRLAMDHPAAVTRVAVLDGVPIGEALARADARFATAWWHWFFVGNPAARAEQVISADPDWWYRTERARAHMDDDAYQDYLSAVRDPATVAAMCEDYRAGLTVDRAHDDADRAAGRRVTCPLLVCWSARDDLEALYGDPREVWRAWADDVRGLPIQSGHHMAEEAPRTLAAVLLDFFTGQW